MASPLGESFWTVTVNNGSGYPIADLLVDVYAVDAAGNRTAEKCIPAKSHHGTEKMMERVFGQMMRGGIRPLIQQAGMMAGDVPLDPRHGDMLAGPLTAMAMPVIRSGIAASMTDSFPTVLTAGKEAEVMYFAEGLGEVQIDIRFSDEYGNNWVRRHGQVSQPAE